MCNYHSVTENFASTICGGPPINLHNAAGGFYIALYYVFLVLVLTCSVRFSDRFLPDKAIDLIDEAGSRVRLHHAQVWLVYHICHYPSCFPLILC